MLIRSGDVYDRSQLLARDVGIYEGDVGLYESEVGMYVRCVAL